MKISLNLVYLTVQLLGLIHESEECKGIKTLSKRQPRVGINYLKGVIMSHRFDFVNSSVRCASHLTVLNMTNIASTNAFRKNRDIVGCKRHRFHKKILSCRVYRKQQMKNAAQGSCSLLLCHIMRIMNLFFQVRLLQLLT